MVSIKSIEEQLKRVGFNYHGWGRTEVKELQNILLPDEVIFECVNGFYDGGFALLLATDIRVLLIDKKPLNYLTVDDLRFDMINELDYNHRLFGAYISISAGNKNLKFTSFNQQRLRKLIGHVQRRMAEVKQQQSTHQEAQNQHLEKINEQLQSYLLAQYEQQQRLTDQLQRVKSRQEPVSSLQPPEPLRPPSPELADYLLAQRLLAEHKATDHEAVPATPPTAPVVPRPGPVIDDTDDIYNEGMQEIFGKRTKQMAAAAAMPPAESEINPLSVAYSKLPLVVRSRGLGRPVLNTVSQGAVSLPTEA